MGRGEDEIERAALLLATRHAGAGQDGPDAQDERQNTQELEGDKAAGRSHLDRLAEEPKLLDQLPNLGCRGVVEGLREGGVLRVNEDTETDTPASNRPAVVAQRLGKDGSEHGASLGRDRLR